MATDTDLGTGATVSFNGDPQISTSVEINSITWSGINRPTIDVSHLGSTTAHAFAVGDLYDPGELTLDCNMDQDYVPTFNTATNDTVTVTVYDGATTHTWKAIAYMQGYEWNAPFEDKMTGTITLKLSGQISAA